MAMLQLICPSCSHVFYRIQTACMQEKQEYHCPLCQQKVTKPYIIPPKDGSSPIAPCKHIPYGMHPENKGPGNS
jgi:hypothetical protein